MWYLKLFEGNRDKISRAINSGIDEVSAITEIFRGIGVQNNTLNLLSKLINF